MTLGREPTLLNRQVLVLAIAFWPSFCLADPAQKDEAQSWTSGPTEGSVDPQAGSPEPAANSDAAQPPDHWGPPNPNHDWRARRRTWLDEDTPTPPREDSDELGDEDDTRPHKVPRNAVWFGPGLAWSIPFGDLWGRCGGVDTYGRCVVVSNVPASDYFGSGPAFELDLGVRLGRHYNLYGLWERTWFSKGEHGDTNGVRQQAGDSDFIALGLRVTTVPEKIGFVLDLAVGTRRMRARWEDGTELQLSDAPFETRVGLGADIRIDDNWSFTPLVHLGLGSFGKMEWVLPNGTIQNASQPGDVALTHGWVGLQVSAHADIFGSQE